MKTKNTSQKTTSVLIFAAVLVTSGSAFSATAFTDWATVNLQTHLAEGTLNGVAVSMSGDGLNYGITDGSYTGFSLGLFSPPLSTSDALGIGGTSSGLAYTIVFAGPVRDPVFHIRSLGSTLTFNTTNITKLSGDASLTVAGSTVVGYVTDSPWFGYDANGSIKLNGLYSTIAFTAVALPQVEIEPDGMYVQLGGLTDEPSASIRVSQVEVCWNSYSNHIYNVQYRSELTTYQWTNLFPTNILATGGETCVLDDIPRGWPQRYYRVVEVP